MEMKTITLSAGEVAAMSDEDLTNLLLKAAKVTATCVVLDKDGRVKYDDPELAGTYGEAHLTQEKTDG